MYINELKANGFHSLNDVRVKFQPGLNVIIGKNNSGKSNIIKAIDYVLGEKWPTFREVDERNFFRPSLEAEPVDEFSIILSLEGKEINIEKLQNIDSRLKIYRTHVTPGGGSLSEWISKTEDENIIVWTTYTELPSRLEKASKVYIFLYVPKYGSKKDRRHGIIFNEGKDWFLLDRFDADLRDALLTTAYVPSFRDPEYQLRVNSYSWYGKLIKAIYENKSAEQIQRIRNAQTTLSEVLKEVFETATSKLQSQLSQAVFHNEISFQPGAYTPTDEYKQITMFVNDGLNAPFYDKGSGIQSALVLALFTLYCQQFHKGSSLLLVEEPELYLHPQARRAMEAQLTEFVNENANKHQVIISTHSPEFMRSVGVNRLVLVRKEYKDVATKVAQFNTSQSIKNDLLRAGQIIETKNAEMFFADHVILVEGGEEYLIPVLADKVLGEHRWLDRHNASIARVNGKGQFKDYVKVLETYGIEWTILADLDFLKGESFVQFTDKLDEPGKEALGKVRGFWTNNHSTAVSKEIRDKIFSPENRTWTQVYYEVEQAITDLKAGVKLSPDKIQIISNLWERLQARVQHPDDVPLDSQTKSYLDIVLFQLKEKGIFVLSQGDLEDYMAPAAISLESRKDMRAMMLGKKLSECSSLDEVSIYLNYQEFEEMLLDVKQRISSSKVYKEIYSFDQEDNLSSDYPSEIHISEKSFSGN